MENDESTLLLARKWRCRTKTKLRRVISVEEWEVERTRKWRRRKGW